MHRARKQDRPLGGFARRVLLALAFLAGVLLAPTTRAVPTLQAGDVLAGSSLAIRVLDGPLRPESIVSGLPIQLAESPRFAGGCNGGPLTADDATAIVVDGRLRRFVSIDLATGSWQIVPVDAPDFPALGTDSYWARFALEPGGSFVVARATSNDSRLFRIDPGTGGASLVATLPEPPAALAVADDGTILLFDSTVVAQGDPPAPSEVLEVDPLTGAIASRVSSTALGVGSAMAVAGNGDVLLGTTPDPPYSWQPTSVIRVDPGGAFSTVSSDGVGTGAPFDPIDDLGVLADGDLVALTRYKGQFGCPSYTPEPSLLVRVDPATGDRSVLAGGSVGAGPALTSVPAITVTPAGSILAIDPTSDSILSVDPATGDRAVVFDARVGDGPSPSDLGGVIAIDGQHRMAWRDGLRILWVDPATGDRSVLTGDGVGTGDVLTAPISMVFAPDGDLLTTLAPGYYDPIFGTTGCRPKVFRVDTTTGDRSVLSGSVGAGPPFQCPGSLVMDGGYLYVLSSNALLTTAGVIFRVDVANGNRSIVADASHGSGPLWTAFVQAMTGDGHGTLYVGDADPSVNPPSVRIFGVDAITGDRVLLSGDGVGAGEPLQDIETMAVAADGSILVNQVSFHPGVDDWNEPTVVRVDAVTGDRSTLSREMVRGLAIVPAPEPDAAPLAVVALAALAARAWKARMPRRGPLRCR